MNPNPRIFLGAVLLGAFVSLCPLSSLSAMAEPLTLKWTVDGVERQALVFVPTAIGENARLPLVFAFHGHGGTMQAAADSMDFQTLWPEALVVYMQGLRTPAGKVDPLGFRFGWQLESGKHGDRDLKFFDAVLSTLRAKYPVDEHRIYATGFSNGGFFSYFLWATRASTFAAFASCAGRIGDTVQLSTPKPILQIAGEADRVVPFEVQKRTIETVRSLNGAAGPGDACGPGCTLYPSTLGAPVETILHSGKHLYPAWASAKIVEFFKAPGWPTSRRLRVGVLTPLYLDRSGAFCCNRGEQCRRFDVYAALYRYVAS